MKRLQLFKAFLAFYLMVSSIVYADDAAPKKQPRLEEMSAAELKEALKKSHSEIEYRLGSSSSGVTDTADQARDAKAMSSRSDKSAYETSAQSQIELLNYKIRSLETNKTRKSARGDAAKLRDIKAKAQDQLSKIRSDNTSGWKTNKQFLDNLLREGSNY